MDDVFKMDVLFFDNAYTEVVTLKIETIEDVTNIIKKYFGTTDKIVQFVVPNRHHDEEIRSRCPFFRFLLFDYNNRIPINYKLESMMKQAGVDEFSPRCARSLVFGLCDSIDITRLQSIPFVFQVYHMDHIFITPIDNINVRGKQVPLDVQWHIIKFLRHPCAELIMDDYMKWDWLWYNNQSSLKWRRSLSKQFVWDPNLRIQV